MDAEEAVSPRALMRALNAEGAARSKMTVSLVCAKLALSEADCVAMFLIGSRLWGTACDQSDWDFQIVMKKGNKEGKDVWTLHAANIDATCLTVTAFCERLKEHSFLCLLPYWLPSEWQWKRDVKLLPSTIGPLNRAALLKSVGDEGKCGNSHTTNVLRSAPSHTHPRAFTLNQLCGTGLWQRKRRKRDNTRLHAKLWCMLCACCASQWHMQNRAAGQRHPHRICGVCGTCKCLCGGRRTCVLSMVKCSTISWHDCVSCVHKLLKLECIDRWSKGE